MRYQRNVARAGYHQEANGDENDVGKTPILASREETQSHMEQKRTN